MSDVKARVERLEKRPAAGAGGLAVIFLTGDDRQPLPAEEQARRLAEAHAEVGEHGTVFVIERDNEGGKK